MQIRSGIGNDEAGIIFTGCGVTDAMQPQPQQQAQAQAQTAPRRREVVVGGRRVKTIDVHAHCVVPKALALMGKTPSANEMRGPGISKVGRVCFFGNDTPNPGFAVLHVARFGQAFSPPETSFRGARALGISANLAW